MDRREFEDLELPRPAGRLDADLVAIDLAQQRLSGGQMQRVGLARAMYGDPVILVLDEPNSNLDNVGNEALNRAIRAIKSRGGSVMIMAHRPAAIQECDVLLVIDNGMRTAFGPKDEVLKSMVRNHQEKWASC